MFEDRKNRQAEHGKMPDAGGAGRRELLDDELDAVVGGITGVPDPMPTGAVTYRCDVCGASIFASTRDAAVTCPNTRCRCRYKVVQGKLVPFASSL